MEVAHNHNLGLLFPLYPSFLPYPYRPKRFSVKSLFRNQKSVQKRIRNLAGRWSIHVKEILKAGDLSKDALVHVVKEGETLSSISKQYGVPIFTITSVNRDIVDLDLVYKGQRLRIPALHGRTERTEKSTLSSLNLNPQHIHKRVSNIVKNIVNGLPSQQRNFTVLIPQKLPHAKAAGYSLVLVPLVAFCIRCVIRMFCIKILEPSWRHQPDVHEPKNQHGGSSRGMRWKSALLEPKEPDTVDTESATDYNSSEEDDQAEVSFEDFPGGYGKLEMDYQKFLSECGIADAGYWRGGSSE